MFAEQLDKIEWGSDSHAECILKLFVRALVNAFHQRQGVVYDDVHIFVHGEDFCRECFKNFLCRNVAYEVVARLFVNHIYVCSVGAKLIGDAFADTFCSSGNDYYLIFECLLHIFVVFIYCYANVFLMSTNILKKLLFFLI